MPISQSAKRALRKSLKRRRVNKKRKANLKKIEKNFLTLIRDKKMKEAQKMLPQVYSTLDKSAKVNIIKKNKARREKSKLSRKLNQNKDS